MAGPNFHIRQARIDVPLSRTHAYLFVSPVEEKWHPWWGSLFEYLRALAPPEPDWRYEPVQDVYVARPYLTDEQRTELAAFLRTAPAGEIAEHRTLRRAVKLTVEQVKKLDVMYFSAGTDG